MVFFQLQPRAVSVHVLSLEETAARIINIDYKSVLHKTQ